MHMECIINETKIKYEDGQIWKFGKYRPKSKKETWFILKGTTQSNGRIRIMVNFKLYLKHRLLYKLANPDWNIEDTGQNNSIDHINIDCTDNSLENLRVATALQQNLNQKRVINAKGYHWIEKLQKWIARIQIDNNQKHLGHFVKEEDARQAYLNAVDKYRPSLL